jgi:pilus assembly protein Flp/PilA
MTKMTRTLNAFWNDESGATMLEYGVMVALIAAIAIGTVSILGGKVNTAFTTVNGQMP